MILPFTILIDSAEQHPWQFQDIAADGKKENLFVPIERKSLGVRTKNDYEPRGDYAIKGREGKAHIERKSCSDLVATLLGFKCGRRDRFENELEVLSKMDYAAVIVECSMGWASIEGAKTVRNSTKTIKQLQKSIFRSIIALQQDYRVPWHFCDDRRLAEVTCVRIFQRYWEKNR